MPKKKKTSWGKVSRWYDELIERGDDTYQKKVILPNLLRAMRIRRGETILDVGCGQGFFSRAFAEEGARVTGIDISRELVSLARSHSPRAIRFEVAPADRIPQIAAVSMDAAVSVLAVQNIETIDGMLEETARVLKPSGRLYLVLNHPAFRIPRGSSWGWDEEHNVQYRRVDRYLSESTIPIQMHPGSRPGVRTVSFHRPLQWYFKKLSKYGFAVVRLEEWISHKKSARGPRASAEDVARKEIPIFMLVEAVRYAPPSHSQI